MGSQLSRLCLASLLSFAVNGYALAQDQASDTGVAVRVSTLGLGLDVSQRFGQGLQLRVNTNGFSTSRDYETNNINYAANLRLKSSGLLLDWFPFDSGLRLSTGLYYDGNQVTIKPKPGQNSAFSDGKLDFRSSAPYLGIGYQKALGAFSLTGDAGVLFAGSPRVSYTVDCTANQPLVSNAQCQQAAANEASRVRDSLDFLRYYPVLSIGLGYRF